MLGRRHRCDRIDLQKTEPMHGVEHAAGGAVEKLRPNGDAARFVEGDRAGAHEDYVANGGTRRLSDEHSINVASRRARVSGRLALTTQNVARLRYEGDWAANHAHAGAFARNAASCSASSAASCLRSYERVPAESSRRATNAASPAGVMRPCNRSSATLVTLRALQLLFRLRGLSRCR